MPRNRTARLAVLGSAAQRSQSASHSSRSSDPLKRRIVVAVLVVASLVLITVYFRESNSGTLHGAQSAGATVLRPFEVAADRVARPFRDAYGYVSGLTGAKSKLKKVEAENARLKAEASQNAYLASQAASMQKLLDYRNGPHFPADYRAVSTSVLSTVQPEFGRQLVIDAGTADGVRIGSPVTVDQGLVGTVTHASAHTAQVTLLVDATSSVGARDISTRSGAVGVIRHSGRGDQLILDRVGKELAVREGDRVVTAGSAPGSSLPSLYPAGIPIGTVTGVNRNDVDIFTQIQVQPDVDFSSLEAVIVLIPKHPDTGQP